MPLATLAVLCAAAFTAGLVDAVVGGGGLIQTPALFLFLPASLPVSTVLGTGKVASLAGTAAAAGTYQRRVRVGWRVTAPAPVAAQLLAYLGARLGRHVRRGAGRGRRGGAGARRPGRRCSSPTWARGWPAT